MKDEEQYLPEDNDLLSELESIGPLSTGQPLEEQKKKIQFVQIKALLKSRKSARDTEQANNRYSVIILIFAGVQILIAVIQLLQSSLNSSINSARYFGLAFAVIIVLMIWYFTKKLPLK